jgi:hypothetical protein
MGGKYENEFLTYKTDMCTSNIRNKKFLILLLHVSAELHHLQLVYILIFNPR